MYKPQVSIVYIEKQRSRAYEANKPDGAEAGEKLPKLLTGYETGATTHPVGPIVVDCFCNRPTYEDRGIRRRAIAGIGRADVGDVMMLRPRTPGMTVVGGSSDHCILDVEDCHPCPRVGDVVDFDVIYLTMLYASAREDVAVKFVD